MRERVCGLLGRKLGHSWSVPIHEALGCRGYRLIELEPEDLASFLRRADIGGLNVTIPYKRDVMPLCGEIDPAAADIGSVNTIVRGADGVLRGYKWGGTTNFVYQAEDILPTLNALVNPYTRPLTADDLDLPVSVR